ERSAAYAADAYARVTGQAGVCDATVGPGAAKLPSGLGEALGASVPVVALVSDLPARLAPHRYRSAASQALDQAALLAAVTKWHATVPDAATLPALVCQAFREATTGRPGPVALFLPQDVLDGPVPDHLALASSMGGSGGAAPRASTASRFGSFPAFRPAPDPDDVAAAVAVLRAACRPFILAGGGVLHSGAGTELTALAEALSAAVGTTLSGKGAIAEDHPLSVGVTGSMGTSAAAAALAEADVVLLAGTKAGSGPTFGRGCAACSRPWTRRPEHRTGQPGGPASRNWPRPGAPSGTWSGPAMRSPSPRSGCSRRSRPCSAPTTSSSVTPAWPAAGAVPIWSSGAPGGRCSARAGRQASGTRCP